MLVRLSVVTMYITNNDLLIAFKRIILLAWILKSYNYVQCKLA